MKISIITISFNSAKTISQTIESVLYQNNIDLEYLIIDGASKDETVFIAESYRKSFEMKGISYRIQSEPDKGIYDAMNKGVQLATGDIIGILNSDDHYASPYVLETVCNTFTQNTIDSCFGNLLYVKSDNDKMVPYRYWKSGKPRTFKFGWMPPHPAFFVRKEIYEKYGLFRLDCGTAADYELMLRFFEKNKITSKWIDKLFVYMTVGGASSVNINAYKQSHVNDNKAWELNELRHVFGMGWIKKIRKLPQFLYAKMMKL